MSDNDKRIIKIICENQKHIILINIILFAIGIIATFSCFLYMVIKSKEYFGGGIFLLISIIEYFELRKLIKITNNIESLMNKLR